MDKSNLLRVELKDIYTLCEERSAHRANVLSLKGIPFDQVAITKQEYGLIHGYCLEGASRIANQCSYVRNATQSGIDALTQSSADTDEAFGRKTEQGEKFYEKEMPDVLFDIEGVSDSQNKYSVVQQFIKSALTGFILYRWYELKGLRDEATSEYLEYEKNVVDIRDNSVYNNRRVQRKYRLF